MVEPFTAVLLASSLAALSAAFGALPHALVGLPSSRMIGWANALAAGLMLGVAYALLTEGLGGSLAAGGMGGLLGIGFVRVSHSLTGTGELDLGESETSGPDHGRRAILVDALHAAHEGVAIGVAMAVSLPLGIAMAATLAVHNIPEAMVLNTILVRRGLRLASSAAISTGANANQVILALAAVSVLSQWPALLPWMAGFSVGALIYLTLVELLPESYRQTGHTSIALVALVALGVVVLLSAVAT